MSTPGRSQGFMRVQKPVYSDQSRVFAFRRQCASFLWFGIWPSNLADTMFKIQILECSKSSPYCVHSLAIASLLQISAVVV